MAKHYCSNLVLLMYFSLLLYPSVFFAQICVSGNTGGTVWRDFNGDGVKDATETTGISGVTVKLFDKIGNLVSTTTTDNSGQYSFGTLASAPSATNKYRIEFSNIPPQYRVTFNGTDGQTDVQFITSANCAIDLGVNDPRDFCQNNPTLATPCYILGDQNHVTNGLMDVFVSFPSTAGRAATFTTTTSEYDNPTTHPISIRANQMGSTWGVAYRRNSNEIFTGAFMKRYAGFGTAGTGAIYKINPTDNSTTVFATLPNGTDAHDATNWLRDYKTITGNPYTNTWDAVGKSGFGDVDILENISNPANDKLYVTNLYDQKLYELNAVTGATLTSYSMPNITATAVHGCPTSDVRPFGLGVKDGKVYVGMVCTGESTQTWTGNANGVYDVGEAFKDDDNDNTYDVGEVFSDFGVPNRSALYAYVYTLNGGTWSSSPVLEFSLDNARGCFGSGAYGATHCDVTGYRSARWNPWTPNYKNVAENASPVTRFAFPQPILSDIEFDAQGFMYLGFVDRGGHQVGNDQQPNPNNTEQGEGQSSGDIMIAAPLSANAWTIESNGTAGSRTTSGANNGQGHGGGEFFYQEIFALYDAAGAPYPSPPNHGEVAIGGLAIIPNTNLVASTVFDPVPIDLQFHDGGVHFYNTNTGTLDRTYRVFDGTNTGTLSGKTAGLGDLLMMCDAQPLQIGNYVWNDQNQNGVQEADEAPLSNITLSLWKAGVQIATTTTNSSGEYYFTGIGTAGETWTSTTGTDSVLANTTYQIRIDTTNQAQLDTLKLTIANSTLNNGNDQNDSDASISGNYATINVTTGNWGENNFTLDFGFARSCDTTLIVVTNTTICNGTATNLFSRVSGVQGTLTYSLNGTTWFPLLNPTNVTPSVSTTYFIKDYLTAFCQDIDTLQITVNQPVSAGTGTNPSIYCQAGSGIANLDLFNHLAGETAGGVWSQTSGTSVGTALNTSTGILTINGLAVGIYVFRYTVSGVLPCGSETADVTVTINSCCPPTICLPISIARN